MRRKSLAIMSAILGLMASTSSVIAAPRHNPGNNNAPNLMVVQGTIMAIQGNMVTLSTLNWQPEASQGALTPQYVEYGRTFRLNVTHAVEETFSGDVVKPTIHVGEMIVAVGREMGGRGPQNNSNSGTTLLNALVVEQVAGTNQVGGPSTTAASLRLPRLTLKIDMPVDVSWWTRHKNDAN